MRAPRNGVRLRTPLSFKHADQRSGPCVRNPAAGQEWQVASVSPIWCGTRAGMRLSAAFAGILTELREDAKSECHGHVAEEVRYATCMGWSDVGECQIQREAGGPRCMSHPVNDLQVGSIGETVGWIYRTRCAGHVLTIGWHLVSELRWVGAITCFYPSFGGAAIRQGNDIGADPGVFGSWYGRAGIRMGVAPRSRGTTRRRRGTARPLRRTSRINWKKY